MDFDGYQINYATIYKCKHFEEFCPYHEPDNETCEMCLKDWIKSLRKVLKKVSKHD